MRNAFCWWSISATHSLHYVQNTRALLISFHTLYLSFFPFCQCKPHQIHDYSPSLFLYPPPLWSFDWLLAVKSPIDNDSIQPSWPSSVIDSRFKWLSCSFAIHLPPVPLPLCYLTGNHLPERFVVQSKWCHMKWARTCALWISKLVVFSPSPPLRAMRMRVVGKLCVIQSPDLHRNCSFSSMFRLLLNEKLSFQWKTAQLNYVKIIHCDLNVTGSWIVNTELNVQILCG